MSGETQFVAMGGGSEHYGLLGHLPEEQWKQIKEHLASEWRKGDTGRLANVAGCLSKLSASLMQISRLRGFHDKELTAYAEACAGKGHSALALAGDTAVADFEGLVLQARATLDRLTWFIARQFGQQCQSFRKLRGILDDFEKKNPLARDLKPIISRFDSWASGLLFKGFEKDTSLRDLLAHQESVSEMVTNCFGITYISEDSALLFDCELKGKYPIFLRARELAQYLSFVVLNTLSAYIGRPVLPFEDYTSLWKEKTVVFSSYILMEPPNTPLRDQSIVVVTRMVPGGFDLNYCNVAPAIYKRAIKVIS